MLAGDIYAPGRIRLIDVPEPTLPQTDGEAHLLFEPELACLCGSDMPFFAADPDEPDYLPQVGHSLHEMIGTVLATTGKRFKQGERVLCIPPRQQGLFERFCVTEARAVPLIESLSPQQAVLSQPLGTVVYALRKLPNLTDSTVAIVGQGPIGQLYCAALSNYGARHVIAIERKPV